MRSMMDSQSGQGAMARAHPTDATGAAAAVSLTMCAELPACVQAGGSSTRTSLCLPPHLHPAGQPPDFLRRGQPAPTYREREVEAEVAAEAVAPGALPRGARHAPPRLHPSVAGSSASLTPPPACPHMTTHPQRTPGGLAPTTTPRPACGGACWK